MTGALEEVLKCWAEEKMPRRKSSLSNGIRTELHYPPSKVYNSSYLARKYPGLWKIQLLPSAFWLTSAVNSSSWWCRSLLLFILLRFTCPCIYKQSSFQSYSSLTCGAEGRNSSMLNLTSVRSCMHTQQFVVNRSWSSSQSTDCRTVPMRKGPFFALVSDDSAVGASQQVNGIERQKPWLWYDFVTGLLCDIEKVTFHLFSLHALSVESCVLFGTPSSSSMFISCLFSALGALPALSKQLLFPTTQSSWIPCQGKRGRWLLIYLINEFNTAHAWNSICTPICISQKAMSIYNIHIVIHKIDSVT